MGMGWVWVLVDVVSRYMGKTTPERSAPGADVCGGATRRDVATDAGADQGTYGAGVDPQGGEDARAPAPGDASP